MLLQLGTFMSAAPAPSTTVSLADEEAVRRILVDTLFGLWATVNNLSRLRPSRHDRYRVTVFGSARPEPGHWVYEEGQRSGGVLDFFEGDHSPGRGGGRKKFPWSLEGTPYFWAFSEKFLPSRKSSYSRLKCRPIPTTGGCHDQNGPKTL